MPRKPTLPVTRELTEKDRHFVDVYLRTNSAADAFEAIGGDRLRGQRYLRQPRIEEEVHRRRRQMLDHLDVTPQMVLNEIAHVAFARMSDVIKISPTGEPYIDVSDLTASSKVALKSLSVDTLAEKGKTRRHLETRKVRVEFHDKMRALDILAKHFKLYADSKEITGPGGGPLQVQAVDTKEVLENLSPEALAELETAIKHATARETATDVEDFD